MKTAAAIEAGAAPSIIKTNVSGIGVAGAIVTARVGVGARVRVASSHAAPSVLHCAAVKIALGDRLESLLALRGVNANGIDQAEAQGLLRFKDRGAAAREQHCANSHCRAGSRADSRTFAPVSGSTDQSAESCGGANGRGVLAVRSSAGGLPKLGKNRNLAAIHGGQIGQLDSQLGSALDAAGLAHLFDLTNEDLAAARHDPAIHNERLVEHGGELVANFAVIAGEIVVHANEKDGSGGHGQRAGYGLGRWGWPRLGGGLRWPVVRIGRLVRVL